MIPDELLAELSLTGPIDPFLVLADWLQGRGDPWGELIALQCQGDLDPEKRKHLELASFNVLQRVADRLCPPDPMIGIAWKRGFVSMIAFSDVRTPEWLGDQLIRLLELPVATLCIEVSLAGVDLGDEHVQPLLRARARLLQVVRLQLGRNWFSRATVEALRAAFPAAQLEPQKTDDRSGEIVLPMGNSWAGAGSDE